MGVDDDFITVEYKKARVRGEMSLYNYDPQTTGKDFEMNTHVSLDKRSTQTGMISVTTRIDVESHPNKESTINDITMYTNQILSDKSNP
jgi:hypothetical protein